LVEYSTSYTYETWTAAKHLNNMKTIQYFQSKIKQAKQDIDQIIRKKEKYSAIKHLSSI
jgi:hypothetical protein